ncbi:ABC transporter ATP-binding protein [Pseudoalteromonas sp. T1lg65]|uniref:ABC transporter ATP-binding protein n=1 Tax=Pseudoalteromonas sp. T1lg65 TaxID=2077101 RepID=UPI003F78FC91
MNRAHTTYINLDQVGHSFAVNNEKIYLFKDLNLSISQGQSHAIIGPSGAGKSSLLMLMSGLEPPKDGQVQIYVHGIDHEISQFRESIGFIFQQFHLLPELTALSNVALPLKLRGIKNAEDQAEYWLKKVGLSHRLTHKPNQLSGGEQQRVAIARALVFKPKFIFADEPTGNLDGKSASDVADLLFACCHENGAGLVVVTHSEELAQRAQHVFALRNGECHVC